MECRLCFSAQGDGQGFICLYRDYIPAFAAPGGGSTLCTVLQKTFLQLKRRKVQRNPLLIKKRGSVLKVAKEELGSFLAVEKDVS
jgi:hypothetical protein